MIALPSAECGRMLRCVTFGLLKLGDECVAQFRKRGLVGACFIQSSATEIVESIGEMLRELIDDLALALGAKIQRRESSQDFV